MYRFLPMIISVWVGWFVLMEAGDHWSKFSAAWFMTVTMAAGSLIAGATSEGGGAVAFPVMTLFFGIKPVVARDFAFLIQSVGMVAASVCIVMHRVPVEWRAIRWSSIGGVPGLVLGIEVLAPNMSPVHTKLTFVSVWLSFAGALWLINRDRDRNPKKQLSGQEAHSRPLLVMAGFMGGALTGLTGSGIDIVTFSVLVLAFGICEKIATPTSVILMAIQAVCGSVWREGFSSGISQEAWSYWYVCVPVVVVGAPLGAWLISRSSRRFVVRLLCTSLVLQYIAAILILPIDGAMITFSVLVTVLASTLFWTLAKTGKRFLTDDVLLHERSVQLQP